MKISKILYASVALFAVISCSKSSNSSEGFVNFAISSNETAADVTKSHVSDYTTLPVASDFSIIIKDETQQVMFDGKISAWDPTSALLKEGKYSVTAFCGDIETEGFDKPYFEGTVPFEIKGGETTTVSIPVKLNNTVVKVSCTQNFRNYYKNYSFKLTRNGSDIVAFAKDETRAAFVDGYKFTLEGVLESETKTYNFSKEYNNLEVATAYTFVFDVTNTGSASITISFNQNVETVDLGDYELND